MNNELKIIGLLSSPLRGNRSRWRLAYPLLERLVLATRNKRLEAVEKALTKCRTSTTTEVTAAKAEESEK